MKPLPYNEYIIFLSYPDYFLKAKITIMLEERGSAEKEDIEVWSKCFIEMASNPLAGNMECRVGFTPSIFLAVSLNGPMNCTPNN